MPLEYQRCSLQRLLLSLSFAALAAGIFSTVVLLRYDSLDTELRKTVAADGELQRRLNASEKMVDALKGMVGQLQAKNDYISSQLDYATENSMTLKNRLQELENENKELKAKLQYKEEELKENRKYSDQIEYLKAAEQRENNAREAWRLARARNDEARQQELQMQREEAERRDAEIRRLQALEEEQKNRLVEAEKELERQEAAQQAAEHKTRFAQRTARSAAKVAGAMLACSVLWDMTAFLGNPLAVPGLVDNAVCGAVASALGVAFTG